jgi:putative tryptophan/tyrosine transport system substrate-binding protein
MTDSDPGAVIRQQPERMRRIGVLLPAAPDDAEFQSWVGAFLQGLAQSGWITGRNIRIETRWTKFDAEDTRKYAAELVALAPDVIVATGLSTVGPLLRLTRTVPIVFPAATDPVAAGLVESLARPGGNVTGFTTQVIEVTGKTFEILTEILPGLVRIGVINPRGAGMAFLAPEAKAAQTLGLELKYFEMANLETGTVDAVLRQAHEQVQAAVVRGSPFFSSAQRKLIVERAVEHRLPTMYETRDFVELGGLVSYGADFSALFRLAAGYIVRILNGAKAGDLPIEQATKFELVINLATAKKLGLAVPPVMLGRADEVIE